MNAKTKKLLRLCAEAGYRRVAIGVYDAGNSRCVSWPFPSYERDIMAAPRQRDDQGHTALWDIVKSCGLHMQCGNTDQANIGSDVAKLTTGAYRLVRGAWETIHV